MKKQFLFLLLFLFVVSNAYGITAQEVMQKATDKFWLGHISELGTYIVEYEVNSSQMKSSYKKIVDGNKYRTDSSIVADGKISFRSSVIFDGENYYSSTAQGNEPFGDYQLVRNPVMRASLAKTVQLESSMNADTFKNEDWSKKYNLTLESSSQNQYAVRFVYKDDTLLDFTTYINKDSYLIDEIKGTIKDETNKSNIKSTTKYLGYTKIQGTNYYYPSKTISSMLLAGQSQETQIIITSFRKVSSSEVKSQFTPANIAQPTTAQDEKYPTPPKKVVSLSKEANDEAKNDEKNKAKDFLNKSIRSKIGF